VLANLPHNSLKYTPAGGQVTVRTRRDRDDAIVEVHDTGRGFSAALGERLFEAFVQGHQSIHRPEGGMGLGLALVKRLVAMHGGSVHAFSAGPGRGATFTLRLPAIQPPAEEGRARPPERRAPSAKRRILVVEDNADARKMLGVALKQAGHEVHEASDGLSAIETGSAVKPEIALVDIGLPGVDGYEVARALRANPDGRRPVLIAVTGYGQPDDKQRATEAGFDAHITKPIDHERLERLIHEAGRRDRVL
jgi:CheY-like chemotaxis protein